MDPADGSPVASLHGVLVDVSGIGVLLLGVSGTGKSVVMWETLYGSTEELSLQVIGIQFSAQTSSARTQEMIEAKLKVCHYLMVGTGAGGRFRTGGPAPVCRFQRPDRSGV